MTAEAAVLNKNGIALAADSAIVFGEGKDRRIYHSEEKIYNLSSKHSVGIMNYGSGGFMYIDWELIFIEFNNSLGDRVPYTLEDYVHEFLKFLQGFGDIDEFYQKGYLENTVRDVFKEFKNNYKLKFSRLLKRENLTESQKTNFLKRYLRIWRKQIEKERDISLYEDDVLVKKYQKNIVDIFTNMFSDFVIDDALKEEAIKIIGLLFSKMQISRWGNYDSGIVFAGYGSRELFPSVIHFSIAGKFNDKIYHTKPVKTDLLQESKFWIGTYAQTDVMQTFISGMDPYFEKIIFGQIERLCRGINKLAGKQYREEIEELKDNFKDKIRNHGDDNYLFPLKKMLASLPVNNLAEIAEALVTLTSLRRHMSTDQETVGGPTDVALITKAEGFVWVKRKMLNRMLTGQR